MISKGIQRTDKTLEERGLPPGSAFAAEFADGSAITEEEANWSSMSAEARVAYFGGTKTVFLATLPVARIVVRHAGLRASIDVPEGCAAYQAARSETTILDGRKRSRVIGRVIGIVRDGEVVEEQFINDVEHAVLGTRK